MKKAVKTVGAKAAKTNKQTVNQIEGRAALKTHARNGNGEWDPALVQHVTGMIDMAARIVGMTPREVIEKTVEAIKECDHCEGWEKRTRTVEMNPSDWKALEAIARAENPGNEPPDVSIPLISAATSRFTVKEMATMIEGGSVRGIWRVQAALERTGETERQRQKKAAIKLNSI